jgi:acyl-coenzyme A synthetase/AMP-(fatty) acid ligase/acyl carrier protein
MWHYADRVSGYLLHHLQIKKGDKIALLMQPSAEFVLLLMGILQTGGVCVPVHPGAAGEQLEEVVKNIGCVAIFFEGTPLTNVGREVWVNINVALEFTTTAQNLPLPAGMDTACCLYTNNAYNRGVLVTHEAIANGACWLCEEIYQSGRLNILADGSLNQIASLQQIFAALHCGATLVFIPQEIRHNPGQMLEALMRHRVNALLATPPMLQALLAQTQNKEALPPLQFVFTAGKWLSPSLVHLCHNRFPEAQLINIYINATCGIAAAEITPPSGWKAGSAGKPVYNTRITLRDRESGILPLCVTGELCIGGNAMAAGYEGKPALSKEKFPTDKAGKKYFKTGEFFRWRRDGQLEYSLQKDKRVKIKGHHISLAEVSWSILNLPGITCLLITVPEAEDRKSMALYYTGTLLPRELEKALRSRLPPYMIPETVLHLNEFPLSPDGAININALPQLKINNTTTLQQPADETEQVVMKIWQQALKTEQINGTDNFFAIGGHSLKAFQVLSRVNEYFGIKLMLNDIFLNPTVIDLAAMIKQSARVTVTVQMPPLEEQAWYRADARQMRVFGRIQFALHPRPYNITRNFSLSRVSRQIFERVINLLLCRHEALRTGFIYREGQLYQRVMDIRHISSPVEYYDFSGLTGRDQLLEKLFNEYGNKLFDFSEAPLWRIALVQMNDNLDVVIICMQHIISDGPSVQLLFDEFNECYMLLENGMAPPPPPELQLKDYCAWQQRILEKEGPKRLAYWRQKLTPDMLNYQAFPGQQGREKGYHKSMNQELAIHGNTFARNNPEYVYGNMAMARPYHGNMYSVLLPLDSWEQLQKITRELGCGYFSLLAAAMGVWMYRQTANQALVLVCPVSYRQEPPWQFITGYLVELMPLPLRLDVEGSFIAAVNAATQSFTEARQNLYPFEQLLHRLNHSIHAAGYLMLHLRNIDSTRDIEFPAEKQCRHENDFYVQCQMDVELDVYKNGLAMHFEYWPDMFSPAEAEFFAHGFSGLLQQLLANPEKKLIEY